MKIRSDFVTNSSSSSFVVAIKTEETPLPKWIKKLISSVLGKDSSQLVDSCEALDEYFVDRYGCVSYRDSEGILVPAEDTIEKVLRNSDYLKKDYNECKEAIKNGYAILSVEVDYHDETRNDFFGSLPRTSAKADGIYVISSSDC